MNAFDYFFEHSKDLDSNCIIEPKETISYLNIYKKSLKLAEHMRMTYGENNHMLLISQNSVFFVTAYLAILKSGNIVVPLNPEIEQSNFDYISSLCKARILIIAESSKRKLDTKGIELITTEAIENIFSSNILKKDSEQIFDQTRLAEIIFTSGSTGKPKGVMITHKNLIANTQSIIAYLKLNQQDTMLVVLPFYYCYGLSLLHTHLRVGGSLVLNNMFIMLGNVINDLKKYKCTGFAGVPTHFQILLRKSDSFKSGIYPDLRYVTQAGGKLHNTFILEFIHSFPGIKFYVMYGQTEATARLSYLPPEKLPEKVGSCGRGIPDTHLRVVNAQGKEVKPGETGEIIASGDNIMSGYFQDYESTALALRNGWLYTGDLGTVDDEGYIYLTARKKEIIKVGGRRVSPKEVEEVIVSIPEVIDCSISGIFDDILGETMKAIIVVRESARNRITKDDIKIHCSKKLSSYKVPQIIEFQDKVTISSTGKKIKK